MRKAAIFLAAAVFLAGCGAQKTVGSSVETKNEDKRITEEEVKASMESIDAAFRKFFDIDENGAPLGDPEAELPMPEVTEGVVTDEGFDQFADPQKGETVAVIKTNMGEIKVKFFRDDAPFAVENFLVHAKDGYYNGVTFHRVIEGFMIQGGDPEGTGMGGESIWGTNFPDEFSVRLHNYRGALSMANSGPNTNGSQFFIVQAGPVGEEVVGALKEVSEITEPFYPDYRTGEIVSGKQRITEKAVDIYGRIGGTPGLDGGLTGKNGYAAGHTVFGQVFEGMDVVDAIVAVETDENDKPVTPVVIEKIEVTEY